VLPAIAPDDIAAADTQVLDSYPNYDRINDRHTWRVDRDTEEYPVWRGSAAQRYLCRCPNGCVRRHAGRGGFTPRADSLAGGVGGWEGPAPCAI
jgi:hypothetical protein